MTIHPVPKPEPREKKPRKGLTRSSRLTSHTPVKKKTALRKVNRERMDRRTKQYKSYMASAAWKGRRTLAIVNAKWTCQRCGAVYYDEGTYVAGGLLTAQELHVHHKTYARFGNERLEDLEVLCNRCHEQEHAGRFIQPRHRRAG